MHRLRTLGRLSLQDDAGRDVDSLTSRRRKLVLLSVLALSPRALARDTLVEMFWGDQDETRARHSLSDALSHLRRVLGTGAITLRKAEVELATAAPLQIDARELARAAQEQRYADVVALYDGPFLDAVHVGGSPRLEQWIDRERARLDGLYLEACKHECQRLASAREWASCHDIAERWNALAPLSPHAALYRLRALAAEGTPESEQQALDAFQRHTEYLRAHYDCTPDQRVMVLADELLARRRARMPAGDPVDRVDPAATAESAGVSGPERDVDAVRVVDAAAPAELVASRELAPARRRLRARSWLVAGLTLAAAAVVTSSAWSSPNAATKRGADDIPTRSPEARALYLRALDVSAKGGDRTDAIRLLEQAISADTGFALAYRKLGQFYEADAEARDRYTTLLTHAYERSSQLPPVERYLTEGAYHTRIGADYTRAAAAYRAVLAIDSANGAAWNSLGTVYDYVGDTKRAAHAYEAAARLRPGRVAAWLNLCDARYASGDVAGARAALDSLAKYVPGHHAVYMRAAALAQAEGDLDEAGRQLDALVRATAADNKEQSSARMLLAKWYWSQGRIDDGNSARRESMRLDRARGDRVGVWTGVLDLVSVAVWLRGDVRAARNTLVSARAEQPLDSLPLLDRPYVELAYAYALVGRVSEARVLLARHERDVPAERRRQQEGAEWLARGQIAIAEGRFEDAARDFERVAGPLCRVCGVAELGDAYERLGRSDAARDTYVRYFAIKSIRRADATDAFHRLRLLVRTANAGSVRATR